MYFLYHTYRSCAGLSYLIAISISHCLTGLQHEGIFRVSGSQVEVNDIKNAFERGKEDLLQHLENYCQMSDFGVKCSESAWFECTLLGLCLWLLGFPNESSPNASLLLIKLEHSAVCHCALQLGEWRVVNPLNSIFPQLVDNCDIEGCRDLRDWV